MAVSGTGLAAIAAGSVFLYAGIKGKSILGTVQAVVSGKDPKTAKAANKITAPAEPSGGSAVFGGGNLTGIPDIGCGLGPSLKQMEGWFGKLADPANQTTVPFGHLRVTVNKRVAADVRAIGAEIAARTPGYLKTVGGFRTSVGASGSPIPYSMHQFGIAIDINPAENTDLGSGNPGTMALHPEIVGIFAAHNWCWGGDWGEPSRDPMHFQYRGGGNLAGPGGKGDLGGKSF